MTKEIKKILTDEEVLASQPRDLSDEDFERYYKLIEIKYAEIRKVPHKVSNGIPIALTEEEIEINRISEIENIDYQFKLKVEAKLKQLDNYHFSNPEIRQCKINNYFILQLSGEGRSLIQEQISLLVEKINLGLITEQDASFEYFYNGGSIEISLTQLRKLYVAMLNIVNSNYQNYKAEMHLIKNLSSVEAVESHDFTTNYLKNQNITL